MSDALLRVSIAVLALSGTLVSGYLSWARYAGTELACTTGGCATVQASPYAELLGIPVATLGLAGYLLVGATALSVAPLVRALGATVALAAFVFSTYLIVVQLAVVQAVCDWGLASDAVTSLLAPVALLRLRVETPGRPVPRPGAAGARRRRSAGASSRRRRR